MKNPFLYLALFFILLPAIHSHGENSEGFKLSVAHEKIMVYHDDSFTMGIESVLERLNQFEKPGNKKLNLNNIHTTHWVKIPFLHKEYSVLQIRNTSIHTLEMYAINTDNKVINKVTGGSLVPFSKKNVDSVFPTFIIPKDTSFILIRFTSRQQLQLPLYVYSERDFHSYEKTRNYIAGFLLGLILLLLIYLIIFGFILRDKDFFYLFVFIFAMASTSMLLSGDAFRLLYPEYAKINRYLISIFSLFGAVMVLFYSRFLNLKKNSKFLYYGLALNSAAFTILMVLALFISKALSQLVLSVVGLIATILILYAVIKVMLSGHRVARVLLIAFLPHFAGSIVVIFANLGLLPDTDFTRNALTFGTTAQLVILPFALLQKVGLMKSSLKTTRAHLLDAIRENQRILQEQNIILEQKISQKTEHLIKANEEKNKVLRIVSHDLKNPVNAVLTSSELLEEDVAQMPKSLEIVGMIKKSALRMKELIETILDNAARENQRKKVIATIMTDLRKLLSECIGFIKPAAHKKNISVSLVMTEKIESLINPSILKQAIVNILDNAIKYSIENTRVEVEAKKDDSRILIFIRDQGPGIHKENADFIFEEFKRGSTPTDEHSSGLGLNIALEAIEAHEGFITWQNREEGGAEFKLSFPEKVSKKPVF